jgi:hypothetical protein
MSATITRALTQIRRWGEAHEWRGYDPYDALNSPLASILTFGTPFGRRLLTQAVKLSPFNVRPLLRIRPERNAMAIGLVASAYARLATAGDDGAQLEAERLLEWLSEHHSARDGGMAWGYHFDVQTRICWYGRGAPNTIATSFVAHALLDACEIMGSDRWGDEALAAARYLEANMLDKNPSGPYFRYLPEEPELVHNANVLACGVLVRSARLLGADGMLEPAAVAVSTTVAAQCRDGSWPYGAASYLRWVDNFHTGYILESLAECATLIPSVVPALERGVRYWKRALFLPDGTPKYFSDKVYPLDSQNYAQAIETWLAIAPWDGEAIRRAERVGQLLVERMLDESGYVHFQQRRFWRSKVPLMRWSTAPAFRALAGLKARENDVIAGHIEYEAATDRRSRGEYGAK